MITRKAASAVLFGVLLVVMSVLAPAAATAAGQSGSGYTQSGTLTLAMPNCIDSFSQFLTACNPPWYFLQDLFPDNGVPTALGLMHVTVQSYSDSSNGTVWYFRVTPGMTWSDGVPANATDLAWSIQQMYSSFSWGAGSLVPYASLLDGTPQHAVFPVNSSVVEVKLTRPFSLLGSIIGAENTPNFTPYHIWKNWINDTTAPGSLFGTLVGVGPYYISNYHQGAQQIVMLPNPYPTPWGSPANGGHPYFSQIVTELVPSSSSLATLLLAGQIDAAPVAPSDVAGLLSNQNIKIATAPGTGLWYIEFPATHYPYNMTAFRHALAYAINTQTLVQSALAGYGTVGNAAFIPSTSPEFNSSIPSYSYNMTTAQNLLTSIGFKMGSNGFYTLPNGTAFQPPIYVPAEQTPIVLAGTLVVQELQQAGIDAQLRTIAGATMASVWYKGVNMYFENQNFGYPNSELLTDGSFYSYFLASGPAPGQQPFASASVGSAYNRTVAGLEASTSAQQTTTYEKNIQGLLASYLPSIPLFYPDFIWAYNSQRVAGWPQSPGSFEVPGLVWNISALATIRPANLSAHVTTTSASSPSSSSSTTVYLVAGVAVVVVAVVAAAAATVLRKKPKS